MMLRVVWCCDAWSWCCLLSPCLPLPFTQVTELKSEALSQEQRYHLLTCQLSSVDHTIRRLTSGPAADRLRDRLALRVSEAEEAARGLREQQREIKDNATTGASQIDMMNDLLRLLQVRAGVKCACAESFSAAWACVLGCCFVRKCP